MQDRLDQRDERRHAQEAGRVGGGGRGAAATTHGRSHVGRDAVRNGRRPRSVVRARRPRSAPRAVVAPSRERRRPEARPASGSPRSSLDAVGDEADAPQIAATCRSASAAGTPSPISFARSSRATPPRAAASARSASRARAPADSSSSARMVNAAKRRRAGRRARRVATVELPTGRQPAAERAVERRAVLVTERAVGDQDEQRAWTERRRLATQERAGLAQRRLADRCRSAAGRGPSRLSKALDRFAGGGAAHREEALGPAIEEERVEACAGRQRLDEGRAPDPARPTAPAARRCASDRRGTGRCRAARSTGPDVDAPERPAPTAGGRAAPPRRAPPAAALRARTARGASRRSPRRCGSRRARWPSPRRLRAGRERPRCRRRRAPLRRSATSAGRRQALGRRRESDAQAAVRRPREGQRSGSAR